LVFDRTKNIKKWEKKSTSASTNPICFKETIIALPAKTK
jgi:hypothetical protein